MRTGFHDIRLGKVFSTLAYFFWCLNTFLFLSACKSFGAGSKAVTHLFFQVGFQLFQDHQVKCPFFPSGFQGQPFHVLTLSICRSWKGTDVKCERGHWQPGRLKNPPRATKTTGAKKQRNLWTESLLSPLAWRLVTFLYCSGKRDWWPAEEGEVMWPTISVCSRCRAIAKRPRVRTTGAETYLVAHSRT